MDELIENSKEDIKKGRKTLEALNIHQDDTYERLREAIKNVSAEDTDKEN